MLETAKRNYITASEVESSRPSFLQSYATERNVLLQKDQEATRLRAEMKEYKGAHIKNALDPKVKEWYENEFQDGVDHITRRWENKEGFLELFNEAKWRVIEDNQGIEDKGEDTWFARRVSIVDDEVIPVNIVLLGTIPDGALSLRILPRGIKSYLFIDKLNKKWDTIHTESYSVPDPENEKEMLRWHENVSRLGTGSDLEFYRRIVAGLQSDPLVSDK